MSQHKLPAELLRAPNIYNLITKYDAQTILKLGHLFKKKKQRRLQDYPEHAVHKRSGHMLNSSVAASCSSCSPPAWRSCCWLFWLRQKTDCAELAAAAAYMAELRAAAALTGPPGAQGWAGRWPPVHRRHRIQCITGPCISGFGVVLESCLLFSLGIIWK